MPLHASEYSCVVVVSIYFLLFSIVPRRSLLNVPATTRTSGFFNIASPYSGAFFTYSYTSYKQLRTPKKSKHRNINRKRNYESRRVIWKLKKESAEKSRVRVIRKQKESAESRRVIRKLPEIESSRGESWNRTTTHEAEIWIRCCSLTTARTLAIPCQVIYSL